MEQNKPNQNQNTLINNAKPIFQQDLIISNKQIDELKKKLLSTDQAKSQNAIKEIVHFFEGNRMNCHLFLKQTNNNFLLQIIKLYLKSSSIDCIEYQNSIIDLIDILYYLIGPSLEVYDFIYQSLAQYFHKTNLSLNKILVLHYLTLLTHLYGQPNIPKQIQKSCFFFNGNGLLKVMIPKGNEISLKNGFFLLTSFLIIKPISDDNSMIHLVKIATDKIMFSLSVKKDNSVVFIVNNEIRNTICSLSLNEWTLLSLNISNNFDRIISVQLNQNPIFTYKLNFINKKSILNDMILFDNLIGESNFVVVLNHYYSLETINTIFNNNQYNIFNKKHIDALFKFISLDKFSAFLYPIYSIQNQKVIDDLIGYYQFELVNDACFFKPKTNWKHVNLFLGIHQLLPILELLHMKNLYSEEVILSFLEIILKIFKDGVNTDIDSNTNNFFIMMSIFFEKIPNELFTLKLMTMLLNIALSIKDNEIFGSFYKEVILNEVILFKFPLNLHYHIWNNLNELINQDTTKFLLNFSIVKLVVLLLSYDLNRYNEYCCKSHYNSLKHHPNESAIIMSPSFTEKTKELMDLIMNVFNKIDLTKSINDVVSLFEFLSLDLSPCLTKMILKIFIGIFTHKDIFLKFKLNEITKKTKFYEILIHLLSTSLIDIKFDILYLILLSNKKSELEPIVVNGLLQFLFPSSGWYKPKDLLITDKNDNVNMTKYQDEDLILNPDEYIKFKKNIHNILLQFLFNNFNTDLSIEYKIQSTNVIVNKGIIDIMIDYSEKNEKDGGLHLLKDFKEIFRLNLVNCSLVIPNEKLYLWLIKQLFNGFNSEDKNNEKFLLAKEINNCILINTIQHYKVKKQNVQTFSFKKYQELFQFGANLINNGTDRNLINDFIRFVINDQLEALKVQIITKRVSTDKFQQAAISLFSVSIDYMTIFNFQQKPTSEQSINPEESNHYVPTKAFSSIFCKGLNMNDQPCSNKLSDIWNDYSLFNNFYSFFSLLWDKSIIQKYESKQKKDLIISNEALLGNLLLNKNNQNLFVEQLEILDLYSDKENLLFFGNSVIICFGVILSIVKNDEEIEKWFEEFQYFILFYIIGTSNVQTKSQDQTQQSQNRAINLIIFSLVFLTELALTSPIEKVKERSEYVIQNIFSLCCMVVSAINEDETKKFKIINLFSNPIQNLKNTCIKKVFKEILLDNSNNVILTPVRLSEIKRQNYSKLTQIFQTEPWLHSLLSNAKIHLRIDNMFNINSYQKKKNDKDKLLHFHIQSDKTVFCDYLTSVIKEVILSKQREICIWSNSSYRIKQIKQASYSSIKKKMFLWKGMWANRTMFYDSIDKVKIKVMNHYSKAYSRPLISVIADINYYLPDFSEFSIERLFHDKIDSCLVQMNINDMLTKSNVSSKIDTKENKNLIYYIYSNSNVALWKLYSKCSDQAFHGKADDLIDLYSQKTEDKSTQQYPCCRLKASHHIKGMLFFDQNQISFWVREDQINSTPKKDLDEYRKSCFGSYFPFHRRDKQHLLYTIPYINIKFVLRRTYYHKCSAIEIYSSNNKTIYFNFETEKDRESAFQCFIIKITLNAVKFIGVNTNYNDEFNNIIGLEVNTNNNSNQTFNFFSKSNGTTFNIKSIIESWKKNDISNFELLMYMNIFGNRSFLDLSQYPVFPWVLLNYSGDYISNETDIRDLTLPVGMFCFNELTAKRKVVFLENYNTQIEDKMELHYLYSTHYSNPIYVSHFMIRLFPYAHTSVELQGKSFDDPDRLFFSMESTFHSTMAQKGDVRELIPEFYCLPELFFNRNKLNMGKLSINNSKVDDVGCPNWSKNNPFYFVQTLREYLENEQTTTYLNKWIDLIFGKKQRGKEAETASNLYFPESYGFNIENATSEEKSVYLRMVEFGIIPKQVLTDDFPSKTPVKETALFNNVLKEVGKISLKKPISQRQHKLIGFEMNKDGTIITIFSDNEYYIYNLLTQSNINQLSLSPKDIQRTDSSNRNHNYLFKLFEYYQGFSSYNIPIKYNKKFNQIVQGGFFDGKITMTTIDNLLKENIAVIKFKKDKAPITAIDLDSTNGYIYAGTIEGRVNVLSYDNTNKRWVIHKQLIDGTSTINSVFYSSELNVLASSSSDGYINLYTVPTFKLYRSILLKDQSCDYVFISSSPVPLVCTISLNTNAIYIYSINGSLINHEIEDPQPIKSPKLFLNSNFSEYLIYIIGDCIRIRSLPDFQIVNELMMKANFNGEIFSISEDGKYCYVINKEGTEISINGNEINSK